MAMSRAVRVLCKALAFALAAPRVLPAQAVRTLVPGVAVERRLAHGEIHRYETFLLPGQFFHIEVEQNHLDAIVRILSAEGAVLALVDNAIDREEPLSLSLVASRAGKHRVEIRLRSRRTSFGNYRLVTDPPHAATANDEKRLDAERLRTEADRLLARGAADSSKQALQRYERVLAAWREIGDRREEAATLGRMSDALGMLGDLRQALERADETLTLWRLEGDRWGEAAALDRVGLAHAELGDQRRALEFLDQALALRRADGNIRGQAESLNDIAVARGSLGEIPEAVALYSEGLAFAHASGDRLVEAMILKNRAGDYRRLGEMDRALADMRDALARFRVLGDRRLQGITEYSIGNILLDLENVPEALRHYRLALVLLREVGDKRFEAFTINHMGLAHLQAKRPESALHDFQLAWKLLRDCGDQRGEAMVFANIARARLDKGETVEARDQLREALPQVQASADRGHEAIALVHLARAERALGDLESARALLEDALRLTESLRGSIPGAGERASFMARTRERYDLLIEILMDLDENQPDRGWAAKALHASERAKARSLVELLAEARINLREGIDESLLARERSLEAELEALRREEQRRLAGTGSQPTGSGSARLDALLAEYQDTRARLRAASPRYAALALPQPLELKDIQQQVLDRDTLLLEFSLGEKRSYVWAVTPTTFTSHELPRRAVVEAAARRLYEAWSTGDRVDAAEAAQRERVVSRMLLGPVADQLGSKRLAIVAEGAIQYVPFSALPSPRAGSTAPLVTEHEIVSLPSATTLAVLRNETSRRTAPARRVAVLADPVFDAADPRVSGGKPSRKAAATGDLGSDALTRSMQESGLVRLERLTASRREAEAIVALAGPGRAFAALDFQASRGTALSEEVSSAWIVHFASHGLLNSRHPELSGIILSLVDERGRAKDGFLQTRDIYKLDLSADLVVLSACQTALGKDVRGEGLVGLSRGFMYAGAPKVVASLWRVPDRATAELMKHFYRGMLQQHLLPAAALRAAQRTIRREQLWSSPYHWAAFTLQGDWE